MAPGSALAEYLKLARSFNLALTAVAPVLGALAMGEESLLRLVLLFIVGAGAHIFGFVLNDYIDMRIDSLSSELRQRPLVSGTITPNKALGFALGGLAVMMSLGYLLVIGHPRAVVVLGFAALLATIYNMISKQLAGMDIFVASAVFFLCVFGAVSAAPDNEILYVSRLGWVVCTLGGLQVLFMNIVAGGLKDIDHDSRGGGRTLAVALGCRVTGDDDRLEIPGTFRSLAYAIQLVFLLFLFAPFVLGLVAPPPLELASVLAVLLALSAAMLLVSGRLLNLTRFVRGDMRKLIGTHYILNYILVPIMLFTVNPYILVLSIVPPLGFVLSNAVLAGDALKPKTM
jgi:4-hydroxybenzoate polyprenyltransferase